MPTLETLRNVNPVTASEAAANELIREFDLNDVTLVLIGAVLNSNTAKWNFILHRRIIGSGSGINLAHSLKQRDIGKDVIWEGRRFIPRGWRLTCFCEGQLTEGDTLVARLQYEEGE